MAWTTNSLPPTPDLISPSDCAHLEALTRFPYWRRSWVYQEASTPRVPSKLWCGTKKIRFDAMIIAKALIRQHILSDRVLSQLLSPDFKAANSVFTRMSCAQIPTLILCSGPENVPRILSHTPLAALEVACLKKRSNCSIPAGFIRSPASG
ncbi:hypothetical protein B0T16DRAFT_461887 [Cercophora newfieldiana]|uniref:Heterokaryon incompatibility domain-containing protein n=1 Tax=Cercophora newfieldiana TaxID=92897 RepID=A0AA39XX31_9PEZI|nr:hypothetical protein B0T16DRAFT_461887 [Cercophora newfieldiana]